MLIAVAAIFTILKKPKRNLHALIGIQNPDPTNESDADLYLNP
jgi:hypothetical protein